MHPALAEHVKNTILNEDIKIPSTWRHMPTKARTKTELKHNQKQEFIPHSSFDLDGDGSVGNRDYVSYINIFLGSQQTL